MKPSKPRSSGPQRTGGTDRPRRHDNDDRPRTRFDEERAAQRNARAEPPRSGSDRPRRDESLTARRGRDGERPPGRGFGDRDRGPDRGGPDRAGGRGGDNRGGYGADRGERSLRPRGPGKDPSIQVWRPEDDNIGNREPGQGNERGRRDYADRPRDDRPRNDRPRDDRPRDDRPRSDRPRDDRPRSDRPRDDRPRDDRPRDDRPREARPFGDRPREDRPRDDRPRSDRPRSDRPRDDRPREDRPRRDDGDRPRRFDERPQGERGPRREFERPRNEFADRDAARTERPPVITDDEQDSAPIKPENAQRRDETRIHGVNACKAFFAIRPQDLIRVYLTQARAPQFADVMKHCVNERLAYHIIPDDELARAAETDHHEGVCFLVRKRTTHTVDEWLATVPAKGSRRVLALENVGNPHNLGAILRTAAHFGVDAVLLNAGAPIHSGAVARTAEGGFEALTLVEYRDLTATFEKLGEAGFEIVATSGEGEKGLFDQKLPKRAVIWFGEEHSGLSDYVLEHADLALKIPGSGAVESLNVSCAVAVVLAEWLRTSSK